MAAGYGKSIDRGEAVSMPVMVYGPIRSGSADISSSVVRNGKLGEGGMGVVYSANDTRSKRSSIGPLRNARTTMAFASRTRSR
jgi:hypothetical protein